ncbi:OmpA family protein [Gallaecimonas xiamenensis]|uniref:OmpA-like domain-containing protein n=1 Tax=Gallaecimonas xiamenensis 3-C-1 TaxID=745411 RepID=K2JHA8_9GAMM|nr:OmpA family protein [Gallaecimonas xiamenensis]EKE73962.1 hypothetical protein B3C1_09093 [Gallaecimonas xiamenensis 3-C-1]
MDKVAWQFTGDHFVCTLALPVKDFGEARFVRHAGEALAFQVQPSVRPSTSKGVSLSWHNAPWQPAFQSPVHAAAATLPLHFGEGESKALLSALDKGQWGLVTLPREALELPSVKWREGSSAFRRCLDEQAPMSYRQARDIALFYQPGERALTLEQRQLLGRLARYVKLDKAVGQVLVDAYTDDTGSHLGNLQLARERAADVKAALKEAGMADKLIQTRAHGDRYPATKNQNATDRQKNRLVTIRVVRTRTGK